MKEMTPDVAVMWLENDLNYNGIDPQFAEAIRTVLARYKVLERVLTETHELLGDLGAIL
jgi:hypothetical protein